MSRMDFTFLPSLHSLAPHAFSLRCGFSRHYRPLPSLLLLHQSIPQTDNLTCSAFHGARVLSPSALCGLTAQRLANIVLAWPWNGKVRSATLLIFTHKHTCTFLPHNHTCMCIDCVHALGRKHYRLFTTRNAPLDWIKPDICDASLFVGNSDGQVAAADWCKMLAKAATF